MKKLIALVLSLILLVTTGAAALAAPAASDAAMTERMKAVTLKVKETLGIGDSFTSFSGNLNESGTASLWSLSWSSDKEQVYVTANENGTIVNYSANLTGDPTRTYMYSRIPRFPAMSLDEAKTVANTFLSRVLNPKTETVALSGTSTLDYTGSAMYSLGGRMKLNGLDTPVSVGVTVSAATSGVVNFYRTDAGLDYAGATDPSKAGDKTAAAAALTGTLHMKLTYALPGDGTHVARLQYLPNPGGSFVVDAVTGKLVDLSTLDYGPSAYPTEKQMSMDTGSAGYGSAAITPVEQASIDQLQGVLSQSALENAVRAFQELGLQDFKLQGVSYYTYQDENKVTQVTANLQFNYSPKDAQAQYRYISLDARTGKLLSVGGSYIYTTDKKDAATAYKYTDAQTEATARAFAGKLLPEELKQTVLAADVSSPTGTSVRNYTFNRSHESVPFPENSIAVGVDAQTGYVVSFYYNWYKYDVTFTSPAGAITADAAAAKFSDGIGTTLKYVAVPTGTQSSGLLLAYTKADTSVWGVNATTGALLKSSAPEEEAALKYDDIGGSPYRTMIDKLASFGVGFPGTSFKPTMKLTQLDALILIESTNGRKVVVPLAGSGSMEPVGSKLVAGSPSSSAAPGATVPRDPDTDDIYSMAYSMGLLTPDEKNPSKELTRAEFVKLLVNGLGYKEIAGLKGIFKPGFNDDNAIPDGFLGYIAVGRGYGILRGDQNGNCRAGDTATRAEAAIMLYNCMSRK